MKISKSQLKRIIKEELEASMEEGMLGGESQQTFAEIHDLLKSGAPERYQAADLGKLQAAMEAMSPEDLELTHEALKLMAASPGQLEQFFAMFD